jgi:hypothetical protein
MGQAKLRGTTEERVAKAIQIKKELMPTNIECNNCGADIFEIEALDSRSFIGVTGVYAGYCSKCKSQTLGMTGDPERVRYYMEALAEFSGSNEHDLNIQKNNEANKFSKI